MVVRLYIRLRTNVELRQFRSESRTSITTALQQCHPCTALVTQSQTQLSSSAVLPST
jgi:hypothetical protein